MTGPRHLAVAVSSLAVWAAWFVLVYALVGAGCEAGWQQRDALGLNVLTLSVLLSSAGALAVIGGLAWFGYAGWRHSHESPGAGQEVREHTRFLGLLMMVLSLLAALGTLLGTIPVVMLDPCAA
jgi:hypothetical protein